MAPSKSSGNKSSGAKKEKVFHPHSRKAGQLVRTQLRKSKLAEQVKERGKKQGSQGSFYSFHIVYGAIIMRLSFLSEHLHLLLPFSPA